MNTLIFSLFIHVLAFSFTSKGDFRHRCPSASSTKNKLVIHHIAIGQGDSTFIKTPKGHTVLIDGGLSGRGSREIIPLLKDCYRIRAIDYVVLTHFDSDHQGGLTEVLNEIKVNAAVYDPGDKINGKNTDPNSINGKYVKAAKATRKRKIPILGENNFPLPNDDKAKIEVVAIGGEILGGESVDIFGRDKKPKDDNSISIALAIRLGSFDYFIGGDLTGGGERTPDVETPVSVVVGDIDVLHLNHHGSNTSNNEKFLENLQPEQVVVSVGDGEMNVRYKLPNAEVMERLSKMPFIDNIFQTARGESEAREPFLRKVKNEEGDIIIIADEEFYSVNDKKFRTDHK
ncbi:MAG: MBL fold metallo-hydrolase [Oligoflexia bacterium]|nr:MBL fold metallo-hydrolase [Oligoflexia bacterium]